LKAVYPRWSARHRLLWTRPANLVALWNRYPHSRIRCRVLRPKSCILKNATPFLLVLSNLSVRCCDVRFLAAFLFFFLLHYCWLISFHYLRYLLGLCRWDASGFWIKRGSREIIRGSRQFVVWSPAPSCHCASSRSCSAYWRSNWWLSKIFDDHVLCHAPSQSSA
jgi:hypothetical protein